MNKKAKVWLIAAAALILIGGVVFGGVMAMLNWDFTRLSTVKYETNEHSAEGAYRDILVLTNTADVVFLPTEGNETRVVCYERKNVRHSVTVKSGALTIEVADTRQWYEHIGINFDTAKITVYIPEGEYRALSVKSNTGDVTVPKDLQFESIEISNDTGDVSCFASASHEVRIKTATGNIRVEGIAAGTVELSATTGRIDASQVSCSGDVKIDVSTGSTFLSGVTCERFSSGGSTGYIFLRDVIASDSLSVERDTGGVEFDGCDAASIYVSTSTGSVWGNLLSDKIFAAHTSTGRINVPTSAPGSGKCEIHTSTGNVDISIRQ